MSDEIALAGAAQLFGRLAINEIDHELAEELWEPERREALAQLGLDLPGQTEEDLERLAVEYRETFAGSTHRPLVQSLLEEGASTAATAVREIIEAAGVELTDESARSVPPDHLGAELLVWAELVEEGELARQFAARHLVWALPHLEARASDERFYPRLAGVIAEFIAVIASR